VVDHLWKTTAIHKIPQQVAASSPADEAVRMQSLLPEVARIAHMQAGVVSRQQALDGGMSSDAIGRRVRSGYWRQVGRGVYLVSATTPSRTAQLWTAVHVAGPGAVLSHHTAAELHKITDQPSSLIHLSVPESRQVRPAPGMVVHRSRRLADSTHPALVPPRTRLNDTVLDVATLASTFDAAFSVVSAACQRNLTTPENLVEAMKNRKKMRWRKELASALGEVTAGVHSMLELRYVRHVERPHGLPVASRQARMTAGGRQRYLDNLYKAYGLCVELDGQQAHPDDRRWHDLRRTNAIMAEGIATLRYGWTDVSVQPCQTAAQIAVVLQRRGWPGTLRSCGINCAAFTGNGSERLARS
jgi:predicted transcriptional regulator of viral defense system